MKQPFLVLSLFSILFFNSLNAQTFTFFYFDTHAVISANFNTGQASEEPGFDKVILTPANVAIFRSIGSPNLVAIFTTLNNAASPLRKSADRLTAISNATVTNINFNLVNDLAGLQPGVAQANQFFCRKFSNARSIFFAWPCAINNGADGDVWFGETSAGRGDFESVVIHEISHTQTLSDPSGANSRYGAGIDNVAIAYGGDDGHYKNELEGDQQAPMDEAFGNYWGGVHDVRQRNATVGTFMANKDYMLGSHSNLTGTSEIWNAPHTVLVSSLVPAVQPGQAFPVLRAGGYELTLVNKGLTPGASRYEARLYRFCDIPGKYLFHSEMLTEIYLYMFHKYAYQSPDSSLSAITRFAKYYASPSKNQRHRYPNNMAAFLAVDMESYRTANSANAGEKFESSIFAIALYDLLTHFEMSDDALTRQLEIATYSIDGLTPVIKSKASQKYFSVRQALRTSLLKTLYNNKDCKLATTRLELESATAALKTYCLLPATLALTE
ncbi:MAG: hypothetical protein ABI687_06060 [Flavitalea sp.]